MGSICFRQALDSDNEDILALAARCPQEGMITFFVNRTPGFNTIHRILEPDSWHIVACKDDQIMGLIGVIPFHVNVLGVPGKAAYMLDLRLDVAYRSGTTAFRLIKKAIDQLNASDVDMVIANFVRDNKRSLVFTSGRGGLPAACYLGRNRVISLIPLLHMRVNNRFEIETPGEKDIPEMVEILSLYNRKFKIAPVISEETFRNCLDHIEGLSLNNFLIARENGRIKAVTACWDEHVYKSYQVLKLTPMITWVNRIIRFLSLFMKVPHPIESDQPLRQLSLVMFGHDDCPDALENLFRHLNNLCRGSDYTLIMLMMQESDPMVSNLKKFLQVSVQSEMYLFAKDPSIFPKLNENSRPVQFDISMIL